MRKLFLTLFFTCGIFLLLSQSEVLWSKLRFLDEPRFHKVEKGESLSKLAKEYYGDPKRWRELALINRAPKPNHLEVGEEILLPAATVIDELRRSRTITRVNALIGEQETTATSGTPETSNRPSQTNTPTNIAEPASQVETPATPPESNNLVPETTSETIALPEHTVPDESGFPWFWLAIGVIMIAGVVGFVWYRRQQAEKAENEVAVVDSRHRFDDRARERQAFSKPAREHEKANLTA